MRICYIHIGMHKTGSTSIQHSLNGYDDGRLAYLALSEPNHSHDLMDMFLEKGRATVWQPIPGGSLEAQRERLYAQVEAQFSETNKDFVISSEELWRRFAPAHVAAVCDYLRTFFDRLVVIVYLREPYSFLARSIQEVSKSRDIFAMGYHEYFPLYRTRLEPWLENVGAENMQFVLFDRSALIGADSVSDFVTRVGADPTTARPTNANASLSAEGVALLQYAMRLRQPGPQTISNRIGQAIAKAALDFGQTPFGIDIDKAKSVFEEYRREVQWAETQLGRAFPPYQQRPNARALRDEAELTRYARQCLPAFGLHLLNRIIPHKRVARGVRALSRRLRGQKLS